VLAEQLESDLANGKQINITEHALLCSTLVRVARQIGINRIPRNVTPTLDQYLARRQHEDSERSESNGANSECSELAPRRQHTAVNFPNVRKVSEVEPSASETAEAAE
jgi:hypothetical protein